MPDSFTETTTTGWFSRIGSSIKGVLVGVVMIGLAVLALFWNEGRAVKTRKSLEEGARDVVPISSESLDGGSDGELVHLSGFAEAVEPVTDPAFGISVEALVLKRSVEMYQWNEQSKTETKKKLGGSEEAVTTYSYAKDWLPGRVDSSKFKNPAGHENPDLPLEAKTWIASPITVGAYTLSENLAAKIGNFEPLEGAEDAVIPEAVSGKKVHKPGTEFYLGEDPANPMIGDAKVSYQVALPGEVSVVAKLRGDSFEVYQTKVGGKILMLTEGNQSADAMFETAQESNKFMTWVIRGVGMIVMFLGFSAIFRPLSVLADVVPFIGNIVGVGTGLVAFLCTVPVSAVVIGIAWIYYRPVLGISLLVIAVVGVVFLVRKLMAQRAIRAGSAVA
ncbi:MAG: TMEM43 family protein [Luteolibacter sp.]